MTSPPDDEEFFSKGFYSLVGRDVMHGIDPVEPPFADEVAYLTSQLNAYLEEEEGVSERTRLLHRQLGIADVLTTIYYRLKKDRLVECCLFGSSIEGATAISMDSDIDIVNIMQTPVITEIEEGRYMPLSFLLDQNNINFPGYVKLRKVQYGQVENIPVSHESTKLDNPDHLDNTAITRIRRLGREWDLVNAVKCHTMSSILSNWKTRQRRYIWPSPKSMARCSEFPLLLVNVGHPSSEESGNEWRISFSFHERELMFSLNPTQHKCFVVLKMINRDIIKPAVNEVFISSYHLKTSLFWAIENTLCEIWRPSQLLRCLSICLWYLFYFVLARNCPNFFIPEVNLFERPAFPNIQNDLLNTMIFVITSLLTLIPMIAPCGIHRFSRSRAFLDLDQRYILDLVQRHNEKNFIHIVLLESCVQVERLLNDVSDRNKSADGRVHRLNEMLVQTQDLQCNRELPTYIICYAKALVSSAIHFRLASCFANEAVNTQNERQRNVKIFWFLFHLAKVSDRDVFSARLLRATLLYKLDRLLECEIILMQIAADLQMPKTCVCPCRNDGYVHKFLPAIMSSHNYSLFKTWTPCMVFIPSEADIIPKPLLFEMNKSISNETGQDDENGPLYNRKWAAVDGKVYFYFISFLVYSGLNRVTDRKECSRQIHTLIKSGIISHKDVAYNLLGWMFARDGKHEEAHESWALSLQTRSRYNAVNNYIVDAYDLD